MTEFKTKRDPLLPSIPPENEWKTFSRVEQWRRSNLRVMRQLHSDVNSDLNTLANETANAANDAANAANAAANNTFPYFSVMPWEMSVYSGTWALNTSANQLLNGYRYNTSSNQNDGLFKTFVCPAGNYTLTILGIKGPAAGAISVYNYSNYVDGFNMYDANNVYNYTDSITVPNTTGTLAIYLRVLSKDANSSDYYMYLSHMSLIRHS